ncbi:hypothetical protein FA13DRAFT_1704869 [Coprinellus micaceus]|uniref:Uncharacterized protein n=1 Tax=Coprinellus micaceus TaxID=71717 RepID=A0A4Y7TU60_COPMI|nr:hypothetical protein FA13DRAFT_1704869 [Coprinellus micaceus]
MGLATSAQVASPRHSASLEYAIVLVNIEVVPFWDPNDGICDLRRGEAVEGKTKYKRSHPEPRSRMSIARGSLGRDSALGRGRRIMRVRDWGEHPVVVQERAKESRERSRSTCAQLEARTAHPVWRASTSSGIGEERLSQVDVWAWWWFSEGDRCAQTIPYIGDKGIRIWQLGVCRGCLGTPSSNWPCAERGSSSQTIIMGLPYDALTTIWRKVGKTNVINGPGYVADTIDVVSLDPNPGLKRNALERALQGVVGGVAGDVYRDWVVVNVSKGSVDAGYALEERELGRVDEDYHTGMKRAA